MNATVKTEYDVYCLKTDPTLRIAVAAGARLPARFKTLDWKPMARGTSPLHSDVSRDIGARATAIFESSKRSPATAWDAGSCPPGRSHETIPSS
jgi:hypothetical protein